MDALSSLLAMMQPRGHIFFTGDYCGDFSLDTSGNGLAHFHVIARGQCWLEIDGRREERPLQAGDLVLLPHDSRHALHGHPPGQPPMPGTEGFVTLICGHFEFASRRVNPVLAALPDFVVVRQEDHPEDGWLDTLLLFMRHEASRKAPGAGMVIDRLSEVLFLFILRAVIHQSGRDAGFLKAFADPAVARALEAIHEQPGEPWSVATLAERAALSRSAFASRFHELVGMTPAAYLTRYRMDIAHDWLVRNELTMDEIAERSGYSSTAAFTKSFKKVTGVSPGRVRREGKR